MKETMRRGLDEARQTKQRRIDVIWANPTPIEEQQRRPSRSRATDPPTADRDTATIVYRLIYWAVPCFPTRNAKVVEPEETVQHKHVHRYGETNIRYVPHRLSREQWQKRHQAPTRPLPTIPYREPEPAQLHRPPRSARAHHTEPRSLQTHPRSAQSTTEYFDSSRTEPHSLPPNPRSARSLRSTMSDYSKPPRHQGPAPAKQSPALTGNLYVSVPIFNETMDHSYRKKYEYIYRDKDGLDTSSLYNSGALYNSGSLYSSGYQQGGSLPHNGGSHYSSLRDVRHDPGYRYSGRSSARQHYPGRADSEPSYDTQSVSSHMTAGSYMSERFDKQTHMRQASTRSWTNIDSDDEDYR